uniref:Uncharacterized protein n=1 Tax=Rhabditophanes sp. KR3021 TaxID=114890 RepID=A0AC35TX08_9BILA
MLSNCTYSFLCFLIILFGCRCNLHEFTYAIQTSKNIHDRDTTLYSMAIPCQAPSIIPDDYTDFCQHHYHKLNYLCDPGSLLSRTEGDLIRKEHENHFTDCHCDSYMRRQCHPNIHPHTKYRVFIAIVPFASFSSLQLCGSLYQSPEIMLQKAALAYGHQLSKHWDKSCKADIFITYIETWYPERLKRPFMITLFQNRLSYLFHKDGVDEVDQKANVYNQINDHLKKVLNIIENRMEEHDSKMIPSWAIITAVCLLALVIVFNYLANKLMTEWTCRTNSKSSKSALMALKCHSDRFRMGFARNNRRLGARGTAGPVKSTMMFRQFSRSRDRPNPHQNSNI